MDNSMVLAMAMVRHCEDVWARFMEGVAQGGEAVDVDFDALAWTALKTAPAEVSGAGGHPHTVRLLQDIASGAIYDD